MTSHHKRPTAHIATGALAMLLTLGIIGLVALFYPRPTVSEIEKRALAARPAFGLQALFSGTYTQELSVFFADTFPLRDQFVSFSGRLTELRGIRFDDVRIHEAKADDGAANFVTPPPAPQISPAPSQPSVGESSSSAAASDAALAQPPDSPASVDEVGSVEDGVRNGSIFIYKKAGYQIFGGGDSMGAWYAKTLSGYEEKIGETTRIYNLVIPSSIEFGLPERYKSVTSPQPPKLENIKNNLNPGIEFVNPYAALAAHGDEYLYFGTDHHWTALGAYYAYTAFCETAGLDPVDVNSLEKRSLDSFLGTLYSQTQDPTMEQQPDHVDYYIMPTEVTCEYFFRGSPFYSVPGPLYGEYAKSYNSYSVFLQGDMPVVRITSPLKNGRVLAVVKESFGNALVPWLTNHYEKIVVIDQRYLERGFYQLLESEGVNELLFVNNIFAAHTPVRIRELETLAYRTYVPPAPPASSQAETDVATDAQQPAPTEPIIVELPDP